jgi:hypothetical protein
MRRWLALLIVLFFSILTLGQDDACPFMQNEALGNIAEHCAEQKAGALCLGHATVSPVFRQLAESAGQFNEPGDSIAIDAVDWLSVSSEDKTWGLARARFPAYPSDGLEARTSAILAFGNVALFLPEPLDPPSTFADVKVSAAQGANLRALPSTDAPVIAKLELSRVLKSSGRWRGGSWLLVYATPDLRGWISESVVSQPSAELPALDATVDTAPLWLPWQSFDFRSGIDDAPCDGAPESGILLQTPKFISPRRFEINGVRLLLSGTAWLQAQLSRGILIHVLDGIGRVSADEDAQVINSGRYTSVALELDESGSLGPAEAPTPPVAYDYHKMLVLPIHLLTYASRVGLDVYTVADPAPEGGGSPLEALPADAPCKFSAVLAGANVRSQPDPEAPIIAVMAYRESAEPVARGIGADRLPWWKLADRIWVRVDATVPGGNCNNLPLLRVEN